MCAQDATITGSDLACAVLEAFSRVCITRGGAPSWETRGLMCTTRLTRFSPPSRQDRARYGGRCCLCTTRWTRETLRYDPPCVKPEQQGEDPNGQARSSGTARVRCLGALARTVAGSVVRARRRVHVIRFTRGPPPSERESAPVSLCGELTACDAALQVELESRSGRLQWKIYGKDKEWTDIGLHIASTRPKCP
ncbi:hypothetical protein MVEN_00735600 [Mycena venus]|uniref:Uncharacterized protein n=1 Tax=Mycena venus TaxID=2733690 RepID=A0A8H6YF85_9AGAR|nr:hypothetical protein MVEN_00735600 [Mycena venus]